MRTRSATWVALTMTAAAIPVGCGGGHGLFSGSNATGSGGGATTTSPGTGGAGGSGGPAGGGGSTATSMASSSSSSGSASTTASSSSGAASSSSSSGSSGGTYPAPFPPPPQVADFGGATLAAPKIYPVFFANDDAATVASLTDFSQHVGGTPYWTAATSEYGVGPATGEAPIKLAEMAPATIDDAAIQQWLATKFASDPAFPVPDANTLVIIYYPAGTTITLQGTTSCQTFGGYHQGTTVGNNVKIAYAVVPRCGNLAQTTGDASHELVEAATIPHPQTDPAYAQVDGANIVWELYLGGGEVGDLCAQFPAVFTVFPGFNYTVQRTWSNKAAKAGRDPCQPELPGEVYFNAAPVLPDVVPVNIGGQQVLINAVKIPAGGMATIPVDLFSEAATAAWTVSATDLSPSITGGQLALSLSKSTGQNGDVLQLTIQVVKAGQGNLEMFIVKSVQNGVAHHGDWFAAVTN